ncbi:hypothetical protein [Kouleothrix sp.]|uniref:hypothetical protein n=1 Tax=Kouleothrix sp. TaxID=2779161 RepID=UPI00391BC391
MRRTFLAALAALAITLVALYSYRELWQRPFAADDYQWLLNVRGLGATALLRAAFDPAAQTHFFRPLVWLLFGAQVRAFGLDPRGFHAVSLALHLLNAGLLGWLAYRLTNGQRPSAKGESAPSFTSGLAPAVVAAGIVALHPAPFEAVVWVSAQSELLAAALLLLALHLWLPGRAGAPGPVSPRLLAATLALGLALLAKESAVIGLPLLVLLGACAPGTRLPAGAPRARLAPYLLPTLLTLAYAGVQALVERRNYLLRQGGYGLGPQLLLNPLRSLALLAAPLPGTEHAENAWLVPAGALVALLLLALLAAALRRDGPRGPLVLALLALGLTLLPTAPFASPPDSRYLYLPALAAALLVALLLRRARSAAPQPAPRPLAAGAWLLALGAVVLALWAGGELHAREARFAAGAGPGGSLWRLAADVCARQPPARMLLVDPPLAAPHAEAIVRLACGPRVRPQIVGRDQLAGALKPRSVVVAFPNGSATVERTT